MSRFAASLAEGQEFLAANPDLQVFDVYYTGLSGVARGKRLRRHEVESLFSEGRFLPGSIQVVDITGLDVEETGLLWDDGDADRTARPVPGRSHAAPWVAPDVGQIMMSLHELDGSVCELDPRRVLDRVVDRFREDGIDPVVAFELEFYLISPRRAEDGGIALAERAGGQPASLNTEVYGFGELDDRDRFLRDLWRAADAQNIPLEGVISECAPGQIELTLRHKADALAAADDAVAYKRTVKAVARAHGLCATFMAKPWADRPGSGMHLHFSLADSAGANLMADPAPHGSPMLRWAIGGLQQTLHEAFALLAPNANSYRRFRTNSYAPVRGNWGVNNRTVALRIPAGPPASRHIEHRVSGADANPYLAMAAVLAGAHYGIRHQLDPGPMTEGNGYAEDASGVAPAPDWADAIRRFETSAVMRDYLGDRVVEMFACMKRVERERFQAIIPKADYDWYLDNA